MAFGMDYFIQHLYKIARTVRGFNMLPDFTIGDNLTLWWDFRDGNGVQKLKVKTKPGKTPLAWPQFEVLEGPIDRIGNSYDLNTGKAFIPGGAHGYYELVATTTDTGLSVDDLAMRIKPANYYFLELAHLLTGTHIIIHEAENLKVLYNYMTDAFVNAMLSGTIPKSRRSIDYASFMQDIGHNNEYLAYNGLDLILYTAKNIEDILKMIRKEALTIVELDGTAVKEDQKISN